MKMVKFLCALIAIAFVAFVAAVFAGLSDSYQILSVTEDNATIRVPGEFAEKQIDVLYNSNYLEYKVENSEITLNFSKPGYYYLEIMGDEYVFKYNAVISSQYEVDLLENEYEQIELISFVRKFSWIFILSVWLAFCAAIGYYFIPWLSEKHKESKLRKQEKKKAEKVQGDIEC